MIYAGIGYGENEYYVNINGHADYAPKGLDIVCAGVSALTSAFFDALAAAAVKEHCNRISLNTGDGHFSVYIDEIRDDVTDDIVKSFLLMLSEGLASIERQYPAQLKLKVFDLPERDNDNDTSEQTMNSVREEDKG